jgi:hypothetical protein
MFDGGNFSKKTKWPKQDSQIQVWLPMFDGGNFSKKTKWPKQVWSPMFEGVNLSFNNNYMI